jgi:small GTP-binding protein
MVVLRQKVCIVGDGTVGKTALAQMAFSGGVTFPRNYLMTMGVDLSVKEVQASPDILVELYMYDIGGQDVYKKTVPGFIEGLDAFVAVFDITSKTSFEGIGRWIDICKKLNPHAKGVLVANKMDLQDKAEVSEYQGESVAKQHGIPFVQVSALRNAGVSELMKHLADSTAKQYEEFVANEARR